MRTSGLRRAYFLVAGRGEARWTEICGETLKKTLACSVARAAKGFSLFFFFETRELPESATTCLCICTARRQHV